MFLLILEREEGGQRERETWMGEKSIDQLPPIHALTEDGTHNPGMRPDWDSNLQPFGFWANIPTY